MALSGQRNARSEHGAMLVTHDKPAHTAVRIARVRLVHADQKRESYEMLLATFPSGAQTQIFLSSPTEEAVRNPLAGTLRFTLDERGNPRDVALVRANQEIWRAVRRNAGAD